MRQSSTVESSRRMANGQVAPHPVLSTALSTLDIQLEEELARYRRAKAGGGRAIRSSAHRHSLKPLDLISVSASRSAAQPSQASAPPAEITLATSAVSSNLVASDPESNLLHSPIEALESNLAEQEVELDDYLASSEELLRSLSEEEAKVQAERGFMRSLVTPLGVGSMLLLLLSSAMFGYVVTNPTSLTSLLADRDNTAQPIAPSPVAPNASDVPQPNLASKEFKDLNLNTLGTLKSGSPTRSIVAPSPSPSQKPSPLATTPPAASVSTEANAQNPQPVPAAPRSPEQPVATPEPAQAQQSYSRSPELIRDTTPAPSRSTVEAAPPANAATEEYRYKVVTPYNGDTSLAEAKKVVPDAFLTNSAGRAENQLGAHSSAAEAEAQVQDLRRQGIQAEVQKR